jgi:AcrR family transcriptional regulator
MGMETWAPRVDAQRNIDALLAAAKKEFAARRVDVNVRAIAARAGVGAATLYRHYPSRSDLISAVFRREIDDCAAAAPILAADHDPDTAWNIGFRATPSLLPQSRASPPLCTPVTPRTAPADLLPRASRPSPPNASA